MNCLSIVTHYLKENGYDGLCAPDLECGCGLDDLAPCEYGPCPGCIPARAQIVTEPEGDWRVGDIVYVPAKEDW